MLYELWILTVHLRRRAERGSLCSVVEILDLNVGFALRQLLYHSGQTEDVCGIKIPLKTQKAAGGQVEKITF